MKTVRVLCLALLSVQAAHGAGTLPSPKVPEGLGVNIHFTDGGNTEEQLTKIKSAGFGVIRMDMDRKNVEKSPGVYTFTQYDALVRNCKARGIRPMFILGDSGDGPFNTPAYAEGFAAFASAAAAHYKQQGIIWELWNEPENTRLADANDYMRIANAALPALREADASATILAPATGDQGVPFLKTCYQQGLLSKVDGISGHFYRPGSPETVIGSYANLRAQIASFESSVPLVEGEWGYSTYSPGGVSLQTQGDYLARMFLVNLSQKIPLSIWYDWANGSDPANSFDNYGIANSDLKAKPAYAAMQALTRALSGLSYHQRLKSAESDWLLEFADRGQRRTLAAWTTDAAHSVEVPGYGTIMLTSTPTYIAAEAAPLCSASTETSEISVIQNHTRHDRTRVVLLRNRWQAKRHSSSF